MTSDDSLNAPTPPEEKGKVRSLTETAVEAGTAAIPFVGGSMAVIMARVFSQAYERRLRSWMEQLADVVQELCDQVAGLTLEDLADDDTFLDAVASTTRIAERNSSEEKRKMLCNALLNIGSGHAPSTDKQAIYLRYIDDLTPSHMLLLDFMDDPVRYFEQRNLRWPSSILSGGLMNVVSEAFPELASDKPFLNTLMKELSDISLIDNPGLNTMMTANGLTSQRSTAKGREFMSFLRPPLRY
jgi:hypothetical protein